MGQSLNMPKYEAPWSMVLRLGVLPSIEPDHLKVLYKALVNKESSIIQGQTVAPFPKYTYNWQIEDGKVCGCCAVAYCGWKGLNLTTNIQVLDYFNSIYDTIKKNLGSMMSPRCFFDWYDTAPREAVLSLLTKEIHNYLQS